MLLIKSDFRRFRFFHFFFVFHFFVNSLGEYPTYVRAGPATCAPVIHVRT
jgi:hypothetical protein